MFSRSCGFYEYLNGINCDAFASDFAGVCKRRRSLSKLEQKKDVISREQYSPANGVVARRPVVGLSGSEEAIAMPIPVRVDRSVRYPGIAATGRTGLPARVLSEQLPAQT